MALSDSLDNVRNALDGLNERERRLLTLMALVFALMAIAVPIYLGLSSVQRLENDNVAITKVLQDISRKEGDLLARRAERRAMDRLYSTKAPSLGSFLEEQAQRKQLEGLDVTDQPEHAMGAFTRRSVRASLPRVEIKSFVHMLADIKNSSYPVAIERIEVSGRRRDHVYSAKFGINAYDKPTRAAAADSDAEAN